MPRVLTSVHMADDPLQTAAVAAGLAQTLTPGDVLALHGDLGAGKTFFVRALVEALGGEPSRVSSPTYVLLHIYPTPRGPVFHLDAYRVGGADDLAAIGFDELLDQGGFVAVEWPSRVSELIPATAIHITLTTTGETARQIEIMRPGPPGGQTAR